MNRPIEPQTDSRRAAHTIRWVLAHEPVSVFEAAAKRFAEIMTAETDGQVAVRVSTASVAGRDGKPLPPQLAAWQLVSGQLEMTQTYTPLLGQFSPLLWSLDLPFLFRDHDHATRVLDGQIGQALLDSMLPFGIRGLAFTYSGGERMIASAKHEINRWEDLQGLSVRTSYSPVAVSQMEMVGARPVPGPSSVIGAAAAAGSIDAAETTWPRYMALGYDKDLRVVTETRHSMFLTAVCVNERFFQSMPAGYRSTLLSASRRVARMERDQSIADGLKARAEAAKSGVRIVEMSEPERKRFAERTAGCYEKYAPFFGTDLLKSIREA